MIKRNQYILGINKQTTRLLIILISIVFSISHAGLIFEFQGAKQFELNEEGKFSEATINDNATSSPSSSALLFDHQGQTALWAENDHTINFTENFETKTSAFPATGLLVQNPSMLQIAEILPIGRLYIAGENRQLVSAVAYADATALLEWNPSLGGYELKYHNIITPEGIEGRTEYPTNTAFYYIKDHLGSIREVIYDQGAMSESVQYHSYGNQDKTLVSSVETRETFTGKEYDEDGEVNGAAGINLYYFGARFFDPETGIWNGIDPAERLFNPFAYCAGNPVSLVDPNGEDFGLSAAIVGAIIAAAVATASASVTAIQENQNFGDWLWNVFWQSNVAGLIGFASGGMGSLAASTASGTIGGFWGGVASGAASGYTSAFISYTGNYLMDYAKSGFDEDYFDNIDEAGKGFFKSLAISTASGAATSALGYAKDKLLGNNDAGEMFLMRKSNAENLNAMGQQRKVTHLQFHFGKEDPGLIDIINRPFKDMGKPVNSINFGGSGHLMEARPKNTGSLWVTGVNKNRAMIRYNNIVELGYRPAWRNCSQAVTRSLSLANPALLPSPAIQYTYWTVRQTFRSMLGL